MHVHLQPNKMNRHYAIRPAEQSPFIFTEIVHKTKISTPTIIQHDEHLIYTGSSSRSLKSYDIHPCKHQLAGPKEKRTHYIDRIASRRRDYFIFNHQTHSMFVLTQIHFSPINKDHLVSFHYQVRQFA